MVFHAFRCDFALQVVVPNVEATTLRPTSHERPEVLDIHTRNETADEWKIMKANPKGSVGPEDPKTLTLIGHRRTLVFFRHLAENELGHVTRHMFLHDIQRRLTARIALPFGTDEQTLSDKTPNSWAPFERDNGVYFAYEHTPRFRVLRAVDLVRDLLGGVIRTTWVTTPRMAKNSCGAFNGSSIDAEIHGGTPFSLWRWPLYVSMANARMRFDGGMPATNDRHAEYLKGLSEEILQRPDHGEGPADLPYVHKPVLAVLNVESWEIYCSLPEPFKLHPPGEPAPSICREQQRSTSVQYAQSLVFPWDGQGVLLGVEFQEQCPAVAQVPLIQFAAAVDATVQGYL